MIAGFDPPQCWHYRVQQKVEACQAAGIPMRVVQPHHLDELIAALQVASLLIVYRQPMNIHLPNIIAEAHRLGIPVVYEADDIVYRTDLVAANPNLATLPADLREAVIKGAADYEAALRACDAVLASTAPLAADMERFVAGPAAVVDNGIDAIMSSMARGIEVDRAAGRLRSPGVDDGQVVIAYGSGSRAHDLDLAVAAAPLAAVLAAHGHVRLRLIGPLALPSELAPFADRIERMELLPGGRVPARARAVRHQHRAAGRCRLQPLQESGEVPGGGTRRAGLRRLGGRLRHLCAGRSNRLHRPR